MTTLKNKYIYLSYELDNETPGYGGINGFTQEHATRIVDGKSSNSKTWSFSNHIGTHVDLPLHFDDNGKNLSDYRDPQDWIFTNVQVIDISATNDYLVKISDIEGKLNLESDLLILRSGFEKKRELKEYWNNNPGVHSEVGFYLRENFPNLKAIGMDFLSLTSYQHREEGRVAHRAFLKEYKGLPPIRIIEDMKLTGLESDPVQVSVNPLFIKNADGAQVTIVAKL